VLTPKVTARTSQPTAHPRAAHSDRRPARPPLPMSAAARPAARSRLRRSVTK
jgi:hypothetical protein